MHCFHEWTMHYCTLNAELGWCSGSQCQSLHEDVLLTWTLHTYHIWYHDLNIIQVDCIIFKQLTHITFSFFPFSIMKKLKVFIKPRVIFRTLLLYQIFRKLLQIEQTEPRTQWQRFQGLLAHAIKEGDTGITPRAWHQQRRLRVPEVFKCVQW